MTKKHINLTVDRVIDTKAAGILRARGWTRSYYVERCFKNLIKKEDEKHGTIEEKTKATTNTNG